MSSLKQRPRRLRSHSSIRELVRETHLAPSHFISPLFVREDLKGRAAIQSLPGLFQLDVAEAVKEAKSVWEAGIKAVLIFGLPEKKDEKASQAHHSEGIIQKAVRAIKDACPDLLVMTDVCLCGHTSHGHCGVVNKKGKVLNDESLGILAETALSHAKAGADIVAPSDMMDGRVAAIRQKLDEQNFEDIPILSYAVKYASSFYGPFRDALDSAPQFGDRKTYQMDYANSREAFREARLDEKEGADILMVKPALPCLDIIARLYDKTNLPLAAYQVSGEYAMICAAAEKGSLNRKEAILESLTAIRRAGAQMIVTYFAKEIANVL